MSVFKAAKHTSVGVHAYPCVTCTNVNEWKRRAAHKCCFHKNREGEKKEVWVEKIGAFTMSPQTLQPQPALVFSFQSGGDSVLTWCKGRVQSPPLWRGLERDLGLWCPFMVFSAKTDDLRLFAACWWRSDKRCELLQTICSFYFVLYTPGKLPERDPAL